MPQIIRVSIIIAALVNAACSSTSVAPTSTPTEASISASVTVPSSMTGQKVETTFSFCPASPPGLVVIPLVVTAGGGVVIVTSVTTRFVDSRGTQLPQVTLPAPIPTAQFGTALVNARQSVTFPIDVRFGCGTTMTGSIFMTVNMIDAMGRPDVRQLKVAVH